MIYLPAKLTPPVIPIWAPRVAPSRFHVLQKAFDIRILAERTSNLRRAFFDVSLDYNQHRALGQYSQSAALKLLSATLQR